MFSSAADLFGPSSRNLLRFVPLVSAMAVLAPGTRILALYSNVAGEPWHERMILSKAYGNHFSMASPDLDIYSECVGGTRDVLQYYLVPADGLRPRGMAAGATVYGFTDFTDFSGAPGAQLIREGIADAQVYRGVHRPDLGADESEVLAEADAVRAETGAAHLAGTFGVVPVVAAPVPRPAGAPIPVVAGGLPSGVTIGVPVVVAGEEWVVSSVDNTALLPRYGDKIDLSPGALLSGNTGLDFLAGGRVVQVKRVASTAVSDFPTVGATRLASLLRGLRVPGAASVTPSSVDARVLPAKFNVQGKRHREHNDGC